METIIIAKAGVTYGGGVDKLSAAIDMTEGAVGVFDESGALIAGDATEVTGDSLTFAVKRANDVKISFPIYKDGFAKSSIVYSAAAAKKVAIGSNANAGTTYNLNIPSTIVEGQSAIVTLIDKSLPEYNITRMKMYEAPVIDGDTAITVMARLLAKVNADTNRVATMSKIDTTNSDGYIFTAVTAGKDFAVNCGGILENADVLEHTEIVHAGTAGITAGTVSALTNLVTHSEGFGLATQIAEAERDASTREGNNNYPGWSTNLYTQDSLVVAGETYNQAIVSSNRPNDNILIPRQPLRKQVHIVIPENDANWAILANILTVFITPSA